MEQPEGYSTTLHTHTHTHTHTHAHAKRRLLDSKLSVCLNYLNLNVYAIISLDEN